MRRGTIPIMAFACGVMVAAIYICQPLLDAMAHALGVPERLAALVAVASQIGYTLGILFVVPLADIAPPKRLVRLLTALTIAGLLAAAFAPGIATLVAASLAIAVTSVIAQVLIPLATTLAPPERRGRIVGSLQTGVVLGILLSRTVSGITAQATGTWRASYLVEALLVLAVFVVVPPVMPERPTAVARTSYLALLRSLAPLLRYRALLLSSGINFFVFGAFSAVWATLAFHVQAQFALGPAAAGLFGLWGAPGALLAPYAGRLADRFGPDRINALALVAAGTSFALAATWGATTIAGLVVAVNLLDFGMQSGQVANQTRIFGLDPAIRGRLNTVYMVATFGGGALGALLAGMVWSGAGWIAVCAIAGGAVLCAVLLLAAFHTTAERRATSV